MDIREIKQFFDYKPRYSLQTQSIIDDIKIKAAHYMKEEELYKIQDAYEYANKAHGEVQRMSGEPYIVHPLRATEFLMELQPDIASIQACILHDVIEDTPLTYNDIVHAFGEEVATLCEGLEKVSNIKYKGEDRKLETIKKTFLAMAKDLRVIFIKLADRIHNIQTLHYHPELEKQKKIATETMKIYVPIAKKLGLYHYQIYLENGCFRVLYPSECTRITHYLDKHFGIDNTYIARWTRKITKLLEQDGISNFTVKWRFKSPYRIWEKLEKKYQSKDLQNVMDMVAFRIITQDVTDAYLSLGIIHKHYTPMIKKIKDYIAVPKFNGYKSIHTTVLGMYRFPVEIQIRTYEMENVAEYGVAAHYAYSEHSKPTVVSQMQSERIERLHTIVSQYTSNENKESFKKELNIEVLSKSTFLYTPKWDVIELPSGGSVLDFAFHIHSDIGLRFKNALVNWEIKPITYIPKTGDVVLIQTWKNKYTASRHRLDHLHTPSARAHLMKYLKQQEKEHIIKQATLELNKRLYIAGLPPLRSQEDELSKTYDKQTIEKKLIDIHDKKLSYNKLIYSVYEPPVSQPVSKKDWHEHKISHTILIDDKVLDYTLCPECKPQIGDKIIAKSSKQWLKIHKVSCKAMQNISFVRLLEAHYEGENPQIYTLHLYICMPIGHSNIKQVIQEIDDLRLHIEKMSLDNHDKQMCMMVDINYSNPAQISWLLQALKKHGSSIQLERHSIS
jgi:GTP diphosphokinase / guanosine-3',5'-bis(diphosphate) 3'-diphosphatase